LHLLLQLLSRGDASVPTLKEEVTRAREVTVATRDTHVVVVRVVEASAQEAAMA
jgi:hypothetical protein